MKNEVEIEVIAMPGNYFFTEESLGGLGTGTGLIIFPLSLFGSSSGFFLEFFIPPTEAKVSSVLY